MHAEKRMNHTRTFFFFFLSRINNRNQNREYYTVRVKNDTSLMLKGNDIIIAFLLVPRRQQFDGATV